MLATERIMNYTKEEKIAIISELIIMAHADQMLKKEEVSFLTAISKRLEIDATEIKHM